MVVSVRIPQSLNYRLRAPKTSPFPSYIQVQMAGGSRQGAEGGF